MSQGMIDSDGNQRMGVEAYTAKELHRFLVADAVKRVATPLPWAIAAYQRIGERTRNGSEAAFTAVLDEVEELTGLRMMPVSNKITDAELARLKVPTK